MACILFNYKPCNVANFKLRIMDHYKRKLRFCFFVVFHFSSLFHQIVVKESDDFHFDDLNAIFANRTENQFYRQKKYIFIWLLVVNVVDVCAICALFIFNNLFLLVNRAISFSSTNWLTNFAIRFFHIFFCLIYSFKRSCSIYGLFIVIALKRRKKSLSMIFFFFCCWNNDPNLYVRVVYISQN